MSDKDAATPRVFLIRHGETEWSRNGRYTGVTDLPLLPEGEDKVRQTGSVVFGPGKLINPNNLIKIFCSPRQRAQRTLELLFDTAEHGYYPIAHDPAKSPAPKSEKPNIDITQDIREWTYADYEGLKTHEIIELRKSRGLDTSGRKWDIWLDGTEGPGAESPSDVTARLDRMIGEITSIHGDYLNILRTGGLEAIKDKFTGKRDIVVVAHGHILRAFVKRWLGLELSTKLELMLEPGGVCGLSYAHGKVDERAILCGMSYPSGGV